MPCVFPVIGPKKVVGPKPSLGEKPPGLQDELHREAVQREDALKRLETKLREAQLHSAAWFKHLGDSPWWR